MKKIRIVSKIQDNRIVDDSKGINVLIYNINIPGLDLEEGEDEFIANFKSFNESGEWQKKVRIERAIANRYGISNYEIESYNWDVKKAYDFSEDEIEESFEEKEQDPKEYQVLINFTKEFFMGLEEDENVLDQLEATIYNAEEYLEENDIYTAFDFEGQDTFDYGSELVDLDKAEEIKNILEEYFQELAIVFIIKIS